MGVWIEMDTDSNKITAGTVTPCMGVWIEIEAMLLYNKANGKSLPVWECGLKLELTLKIFWKKQVTPCMGVWIEIELDGSSGIKYASLPVWECGLKYMEHFSLTKNLCHSLYGSVDWNGHWQ